MDLPREAGPPGPPGLRRTLTAPFGLFSPGSPSRKPSVPGVFPGPWGGAGGPCPARLPCSLLLLRYSPAGPRFGPRPAPGGECRLKPSQPGPLGHRRGEKGPFPFQQPQENGDRSFSLEPPELCKGSLRRKD